MTKLVTAAPRVPTCRIVFRPYLVRRKELRTAEPTCSKFKIEGKTGLNDDRLPSAIARAYVATALIPTNCWSKAK